MLPGSPFSIRSGTQLPNCPNDMETVYCDLISDGLLYRTENRPKTDIMEIAEITSARLRQALNAFQQAQSPPEELLALDFLRDVAGHSPAERQIYLRDWLYQVIQTHLRQFRNIEELPLPNTQATTKQQITAVLAADFSHNNPELEAWSALYHRHCISLGMSVNEMAQAAAIVPRHFSRHVQIGLDLLTDAVRRQEIAVHDRFRTQRLRRYLPPPDYAQLFGSERLVRQLTQLMQQENGPRVVSIEGLGGIGKTALARAFVNEMAETGHLEGIAWISARHEWLTSQGELQSVVDPARSLADILSRLAEQLGQPDLGGLAVEEKVARLHPVLNATPHMVVIDNLETFDDVALLLPVLATLKEVTRFLLTSRHSLSKYPFVHRLPIPPLSQADSQALLESELARHGRSIELETDTMNQLHHIIGGVPLALKLTAAQLAHLPLSDVMTGLQKANRQTSEHLFTYIYMRTWQLLERPAKVLLLSLLSISPDGEDVAWLRLMSGLPEHEFEAALRQLIAYSLLEVAGSSEMPLYRIHRLTTTFLQTEILLNWST